MRKEEFIKRLIEKDSFTSKEIYSVLGLSSNYALIKSIISVFSPFSNRNIEKRLNGNGIFYNQKGKSKFVIINTAELLFYINKKKLVLFRSLTGKLFKGKDLSSTIYEYLKEYYFWGELEKFNTYEEFLQDRKRKDDEKREKNKYQSSYHFNTRVVNNTLDFKRIAKICHPDKYIQEHDKRVAHALFVKLKSANDSGDHKGMTLIEELATDIFKAAP